MNSKQMEGAIFLLLILFGVLLLSGIPFLVSKHPAKLGHNFGFEGFSLFSGQPTSGDSIDQNEQKKPEIITNN